MKIEISNNIAVITYKQNQRMTSKTISLDTLSELFKTNEGISTPILPIGCRNYVRNDKKHVICLEVPPAKRQFNYKNGSGKSISKGMMAMPRFLFFMTFIEEEKGFRFNSAMFKMFALSDPLLSSKDKLFLSPLPNSHDRGSVCWGNTFRSNNEGLLIDDLSKAYRFVDIFFSGDFNTDISIKYVPSGSIQRPEDLYREMIEKDSFDKKYLKLSSYKVDGVMKELSK